MVTDSSYQIRMSKVVVIERGGGKRLIVSNTDEHGGGRIMVIVRKAARRSFMYWEDSVGGISDVLMACIFLKVRLSISMAKDKEEGPVMVEPPRPVSLDIPGGCHIRDVQLGAFHILAQESSRWVRKEDCK